MQPKLTPSADDRLPDFFPRTVKQCEKPSGVFFQCLLEKSIKLSDEDTSAGSRGLQACLKLKKDYEKCMIAQDSKKEPKRHRVQEEYRIQAVDPKSSTSPPVQTK